MAKTGPGYASPLDAMKKGPREEILYVVAVQPKQGGGKTDLLATVDVDPKSPTYCQIIHRLRTGNEDDELHHSGWNVCSSCYVTKGCCAVPTRDKLVLPALGSDRVYIVDTGKNLRAPEIHKVIDASEMVDHDCRTPHTAHCLATGEIMISIMGDKEGNGKCDFILIDGTTYKTKEDEELSEPPKPLYIKKGRRFYGAPQMLQLSLDGTRLYVSTSIFSPWDKQIYPEMVANGGSIVKLDVDTVNGGIKLDEDFLVDFGEGPDGPLLPHEMR
ncbi:hypothetical protein NQ314_008668 [Rhamnusium bicolor]|uniref:Selenium-binding protein 1 n=1 Tax=Rhamnusium bicolor TaxID=1586634 RepID=A0AAV8Y8R0_9CUCU|nr:hypothetical protein NQ314_008668 [Rhamnusium bicolor]